MDEDTIQAGSDVTSDPGAASAAPAADAGQQASQPAFHTKFGLGDEWNGRSAEDIATHFHQERTRDRENYNNQLRQAIAREQGIFQSPEWQEFNKWKQSQGQAPKAESEPKPWERPEFQMSELDEWIADVKDPVTGEVTGKDWKPNAPADLLQRASKYNHWKKEFQKQWSDDPFKAYDPYIEHRAKEVAEKLFQEKFQEQQLNQRMLDLEKQHAGWMYEKDPQTGQFLVDNNGYPVFSPFGQAAFDIQNQIKQSSQDPVQLMNLAMQFVRGQLVESEYEKLTKAQQAEQANEDKKTKFNERIAQQTSNRSGSLQKGGDKPKPRQNKKQTFAEEMRQALQAAGQTDPNLRWE